MKILISSCTQHDEEGFKNTKLYESILQDSYAEHITKNTVSYVTNNYYAVVRHNNKENIGIHYNRTLALGREEGFDCVICLHDAVSIEDNKLVEKLTEAFKTYNIVGLAGATNVSLKKPVLWHLLCNDNERSGIVAHTHGKHISSTYFGPTPSRCILLDGLFLAVRLEGLPENVLFDEKLPAVAHHYDLDFCLTANKNKLKLTTWPIWVVHDSPGLENPDKDFYDSENYFLDKWLKN